MTDYQVLISLNLPLTTASKLRDVQDEERNLWKWPHVFLCDGIVSLIQMGLSTVRQMHLLQIFRLLQDNSLTMSGPSRHKRFFSFLLIKGKRNPWVSAQWINISDLHSRSLEWDALISLLSQRWTDIIAE